mmetsp:Transcript_5721/g.15514  ORF Transcript_5721/g.15514 Transcript_5721/m.15514 type:complete len:130 (-) Transcript_5721:333-722(-)
MLCLCHASSCNSTATFLDATSSPSRLHAQLRLQSPTQVEAEVVESSTTRSEATADNDTNRTRAETIVMSNRRSSSNVRRTNAIRKVHEWRTEVPSSQWDDAHESLATRGRNISGTSPTQTEGKCQGLRK